MTSMSLLATSSWESLVKRMMAHLDWIGSMILEESLQARANQVVEEYSVMTILKAYYAAFVIASASSKMTNLCIPSGTVTFLFANCLIFSLTTSIPLSSEAFSSKTAFFAVSPSMVLARAMTEVVLPVPGGPTMMQLGRFPCSEMALS